MSVYAQHKRPKNFFRAHVVEELCPLISECSFLLEQGVAKFYVANLTIE